MSDLWKFKLFLRDRQSRSHAVCLLVLDNWQVTSFGLVTRLLINHTSSAKNFLVDDDHDWELLFHSKAYLKHPIVLSRSPSRYEF